MRKSGQPTDLPGYGYLSDDFSCDPQAKPQVKSASVYFYTGDFADVIRRHDAGEDQIYATHNEVALFAKNLVRQGVELTIHSFITPEARVDNPIDGLRIVSLGAQNWNDRGVLKSAVEQDTAEAIIANSPSLELLESVIAARSRAIAVLANSYMTTGLKAYLDRRRIRRLLNNQRFELVSNHCKPATTQLASMGVHRDKLIAWNIPQRFYPSDAKRKSLKLRGPQTVAYAGGVRANKGVGDLIAAIADLKRKGLLLECKIAGGGDLNEMRALSEKLGVAGQVSFLGLIPNSNVISLFQNSDAVVVGSHPECTEGFPLTMFEAIASRTPVVCSNHPMFTPVMKDRVTASVFKAKNPRSLAYALESTLTNPGLYARLSQNADRSWADLKGTADWRTMATEWILNGRQSNWLREHMLFN